MSTVNQEFQSAPASGRVLFQMIFGLLAMFIAFTFGTVATYQGLSRHPNSVNWIFTAIAPVTGLIVAVPAFLAERVRISKFRIEDNSLVLGKRRYPMAGLIDAVRDPELLKGARKAFVWEGLKQISFQGRKGFASIQGNFKSKRLGLFYAFLTGTDHAVVLRWPDKVVAVSPADPEFFIYMARSAAGIR
jgi:hypothetical protein